jgi:hypothetical protein
MKRQIILIKNRSGFFTNYPRVLRCNKNISKFIIKLRGLQSCTQTGPKRADESINVAKFETIFISM